MSWVCMICMVRFLRKACINHYRRRHPSSIDHYNRVFDKFFLHVFHALRGEVGGVFSYYRECRVVWGLCFGFPAFFIEVAYWDWVSGMAHHGKLQSAAVCQKKRWLQCFVVAYIRNCACEEE